VTAAIDLTLALVEEDVRRSLALAVARHLVMFLKRPGGQAQFRTVLSLQGAEDRFGAGTLHCVKRRSQHGGIDMVEERSEPLLLPLPCGLPYAVQRL
jgi:hypothetical protein